MSDRHVVIVGGGQAGGRIALSLREAGHQGPITLVADEAYPPYERPPLSKGVLVGDVEPETTLLASAAQLDQSGITLIAGVRASRLDALSRLLHLEDGRSLEFDALALATGARPRRFVPEGAVEPLPGLRSMDDALALRQRLLPGTTLAVIGGGVIGLELASSALACGARPVLIEAADRLMARQIGPAASAFVEARHRAAGTELHLGRTLRRIDPEANGVRLILDDGTVIAAGTVVAAIGVVPDTALAEAAGIACDDGILTDADGRTSQPGIWAAGDVARAVVPWSDRPERQESWRNAETQARRVAASILGRPAWPEAPVRRHLRRNRDRAIFGGRTLRRLLPSRWAAQRLHGGGQSQARDSGASCHRPRPHDRPCGLGRSGGRSPPAAQVRTAS